MGENGSFLLVGEGGIVDHRLGMDIPRGGEITRALLLRPSP